LNYVPSAKTYDIKLNSYPYVLWTHQFLYVILVTSKVVVISSFDPSIDCCSVCPCNEMEALNELANHNVLSAPVIDLRAGVQHKGFLSLTDIVMDLASR